MALLPPDVFVPGMPTVRFSNRKRDRVGNLIRTQLEGYDTSKVEGDLDEFVILAVGFGATDEEATDKAFDRYIADFGVRSPFDFRDILRK